MVLDSSRRGVTYLGRPTLVTAGFYRNDGGSYLTYVAWQYRFTAPADQAPIIAVSLPDGATVSKPWAWYDSASGAWDITVHSIVTGTQTQVTPELFVFGWRSTPTNAYGVALYANGSLGADLSTYPFWPRESNVFPSATPPAYGLVKSYSKLAVFLGSNLGSYVVDNTVTTTRQQFGVSRAGSSIGRAAILTKVENTFKDFDNPGGLGSTITYWPARAVFIEASMLP